MSRNCSFCGKDLKNAESYIVMHDKCFEKYKSEDKTPDNYILMMGKHKGSKFSDIQKRHSKYIEWCMKQEAEDDSPMHFFQMYVTKFRKEEEQSKEKKKKKKPVEKPTRVKTEDFSDSDLEPTKKKEKGENVSEDEDDI